MKECCYLLSLEEFLEGAEGRNGEMLLREAFCKVDEDRRKKAEQMKSEVSRAACIGAGLLLQLAVQEALGEEDDHGARVQAGADEDIVCPGRKEYGHQLSVYTVSQILNLLGKPRNLKLYYGERGKPYLKEYPFFFNLSHSGRYVVCAVSRQEVGVDIQHQGRTEIARLAERFFSAEEKEVLKSCHDWEEQVLLFYRLWTRKEAYGKLTGEGIAAVIEKSVLPADVRRSSNGSDAGTGSEVTVCRLDAWQSQPDVRVWQTTEWNPVDAGVENVPPVFWQEWRFADYQIALCRKGKV